MAARGDVETPPEEFRRALDELTTARLRPEVFTEQMPAPQRIAPFSGAISADVTIAGDDVGGGRLVLLYDPAGNEAWEGVFRCVAYARADTDAEMIADPVFGGVAWGWLTEALDSHGASYVAPSGTVTKVASESFGGMADEDSRAEVEVRASWTPCGPIGPHVQAWGDLLCIVSGLPPVPDGVAVMPGRRGPRRR